VAGGASEELGGGGGEGLIKDLKEGGREGGREGGIEVLFSTLEGIAPAR
jgi:hypothetical protein